MRGWRQCFVSNQSWCLQAEKRLSKKRFEHFQWALHEMTRHQVEALQTAEALAER
jgi:hypothetical protein